MTIEAMTQNEGLGNRLVAKPQLFDDARIELRVPGGLTVEQHVLRVVADPFMQQCAVVYIGGHKIDRAHWGHVWPKPGVEITLKIVPMGAAKKILRTILTLALVVAAFYLAPVIVGGVLGPATLSGLQAGTILGANALGAVVGAVTGAITLTGMLLINSLTSVKPPKIEQERPATSFSGFNNSVSAGAPIPVVLGRMRYYPPFAALPYSELVGDDQYLRAIFCFGYGPLEISDIRVGETPISDFEDVMVQIQRGFPGETYPQLFTRDVTEESLSIQLEAGNTVTRETADGTKEAVFDIGFITGLVENDPKKGTRKTTSVSFTIRYRKAGTSDPLQNITAGFPSSGVIAEAASFPSFPSFPGVVIPPLDFWNAPVGTTSVRTFSGKTRLPMRRSVSIIFPSTGKWEVHITRTTADAGEDSSKINRSDLVAFRSIKHSRPINRTGLCLVAVRIRASNQLSQGLNTFNAVAQRLYPVWNGSAWINPTSAMSSASLVQHRTSNPAYAYAYILRGAASARPIADDRLHYPSLTGWRDACDAPAPTGGGKRWAFNGVIDFDAQVWEIMRDIAAAGRARPTVVDGKHGILRDKAQSTPVQMFTPRNSRNHQGQIVYVDLPHGLNMKIADAARDYAERDVPVYRDGFHAGNATKVEDTALFGVTSAAQAWREGRYQLAVGELRPEITAFDADIEAIVCNAGDRVYVQHDVPRFGLGAGRIKSVTLDGNGDAISLETDDFISMEEGKSYVLRVRLVEAEATGRFVDAGINMVPGETNAPVFSTPLTGAEIPKPGDLYAFGEVGSVTRDCIVKEIQPLNDLDWRLTVLDYAPPIYTADTGLIPAFDPGPSGDPEIAPPGAVRNLTLTEDVLFSSSGQPVSDINASWQPPLGISVASYEIYRLQNSRFTLLDVRPGSENQLPLGLQSAESITIAVLAVSSTGRKLPLTEAAQATLVLTGDDGAPSRPDTFTVARLADGTRRFEWIHDTPEPDVAGYEIRFESGASGTWESATALHTGLLTVSPLETNELAAGTYTFLIKSKDHDGNYSEDHVAIIATLGDPRLKNVILQRLEASLNWPGVKTDCAVVGGKVIALTDGTWADLSGTDWNDYAAGDWRFGLGAKSPIIYETPEIDLGADFVFTPLVTVTGAGIPTITMQAGTDSDGAVTGAFVTPVQATARYVKIRVSMADIDPMINQITTLLDAELVTEDFEDIDTSSAPDIWFSRIATGHFRIGSKGNIQLIAVASIRALQNVGAGYSWELISKAQNVNGEVAAEFKVYDGSGSLSDATVDVELKGPKKES